MCITTSWKTCHNGFLGPIPRVYDSVGRSDPITCISKKLQGEADVCWPEAHTLETIDLAIATAYSMMLPHTFIVITDLYE